VEVATTKTLCFGRVCFPPLPYGPPLGRPCPAIGTTELLVPNPLLVSPALRPLRGVCPQRAWIALLITRARNRKQESTRLNNEIVMSSACTTQQAGGHGGGADARRGDGGAGSCARGGVLAGSASKACGRALARSSRNEGALEPDLHTQGRTVRGVDRGVCVCVCTLVGMLGIHAPWQWGGVSGRMPVTCCSVQSACARVA
jgi:hypothetical protein